jgi:hypothetical protein
MRDVVLGVTPKFHQFTLSSLFQSLKFRLLDFEILRFANY